MGLRGEQKPCRNKKKCGGWSSLWGEPGKLSGRRVKLTPCVTLQGSWWVCPGHTYHTLKGGKARTKISLPLSLIRRLRAHSSKGAQETLTAPQKVQSWAARFHRGDPRGGALFSILALLNFTSLSLRFLICAPGQEATVHRLLSSPLVSIPRLLCHGEIEPLLSETHRPHLPGLGAHSYGKEPPVNVSGVREEDHQLRTTAWAGHRAEEVSKVSKQARLPRGKREGGWHGPRTVFWWNLALSLTLPLLFSFLPSLSLSLPPSPCSLYLSVPFPLSPSLPLSVSHSLPSLPVLSFLPLHPPHSSSPSHPTLVLPHELQASTRALLL